MTLSSSPRSTPAPILASFYAESRTSAAPWSSRSAYSQSVLLSIRDYVRLAAPEPEVLKLIGEESRRKARTDSTRAKLIRSSRPLACQDRSVDQDSARRKKLGIGAPGEDRYPYVPDLNGPDHMEIIATELAKRGQPASVIEKVLEQTSSV